MTSILPCSTFLSFYPRRSLGSNISRQAFTSSQSEDPDFSRKAFDSTAVTFDGSNTSLAGLKQTNRPLTNGIVKRRLTTGIRCEKCVVRRFRRCVNIIEVQCTYTNLYSIANIDMRRLTTGIRSQKCVVMRFRRCANIIEVQCTYTNLDSTVNTDIHCLTFKSRASYI
jgi:hypothetical protein